MTVSQSMERLTMNGRSLGLSPGYAMAGLLVATAVMGIFVSVAMPVWTQIVLRDREAELVFRGEQYARSVELYQRTFAGAFPPDLETLLEGRFLRKAYGDPMLKDQEFRLIFEGDLDEDGILIENNDRGGQNASQESLSTGLIGVVSRSEKASVRLYKGESEYNKWFFVHGQGEVAGRDEFASDQGNELPLGREIESLESP